ncbi:MAG: flagellar hook-basal body complex protein FliE [Acidobacteriia bacterium]|jgi:flagellar hook-basal body complex protein FliE|nr:flagellar hook-basal body complex protein FliE [Terriglobia bacterium]
MSTPLAPVSNVAPAPLATPLPGSRAPGPAAGFGALFENAVRGVENVRQESTQAVEKFLTGEGGELHTTVLATQRAELAFQLFLQVRNKVVEAYQEIMRMQT